MTPAIVLHQYARHTGPLSTGIAPLHKLIQRPAAAASAADRLVHCSTTFATSSTTGQMPYPDLPQRLIIPYHSPTSFHGAPPIKTPFGQNQAVILNNFYQYDQFWTAGSFPRTLSGMFTSRDSGNDITQRLLLESMHPVSGLSVFRHDAENIAQQMKSTDTLSSRNWDTNIIDTTILDSMLEAHHRQGTVNSNCNAVGINLLSVLALRRGP